jgi:hypothetical protein
MHARQQIITYMLLNVNKSEALNGRRTLMTEEEKKSQVIHNPPYITSVNKFSRSLCATSSAVSDCVGNTLFPAISSSAVLFLIPSYLKHLSKEITSNMSSDTWPPQLKFVTHVYRSC